MRQSTPSLYTASQIQTHFWQNDYGILALLHYHDDLLKVARPILFPRIESRECGGITAFKTHCKHLTSNTQLDLGAGLPTVTLESQ